MKDGATCCLRFWVDLKKIMDPNTLYMQKAVVSPLRVWISTQSVPTRTRQTDGSDFLHVNMTLPDKSLSFLALCVLVIILDRRNYRLLQRRVCGCSNQSHAALKGLRL